jgi:hypothetical protein
MDETLVAGIIGAVAGVAGAGVVAWASVANTKQQIQGATADVEKQLRQAREDLDRQLTHDRELRDLADLRAALQPLITRVKTEGSFFLDQLLEEHASGSEMWRSMAHEMAVEIARYGRALIEESSALLVTVGPGNPVVASISVLQARASDLAEGLSEWGSKRGDTDEVMRLLAAYEEADGEFVVAAYLEIGRQHPDMQGTGTKAGTRST